MLRTLVDSGSDATMIPIRYLQRIGAKIVDRRQMRGSANISYWVDVYAIGLYNHAALEVLGNRQGDDIIVGHDV